MKSPGPLRLCRVLALLFAAPVMVGLVLVLGSDPVKQRSQQALTHREGGFAGAESCAPCHPDHHASWARTFHSTMTQRPTRAAVRGAFDGRSVSYAGQSVKLSTSGDQFQFEFPERVARVALAVGSRRYQQYFEEVERGFGSVLLRLPFVWHIEQERWLHLNTVFLNPDDSNWDAHRATWNGNCLFCHNTGPRPGALGEFEAMSAGMQSFASSAADLGIACEACHGPGEEHVRRFADPLARYAQNWDQAPVADIVNPARLDQERSTSVCGQCHGQRLPEPAEQLSQWLREGPSFRAGAMLAEHVAPITCETVSLVPGQPRMFRDRFWNDGTPRLSAYEYQGLVASACYAAGELTCITCHSMHGGDPAGMVTKRERAGAACLVCHEEIAQDVSAHTKHRADGPGSACLDCHMPRIVYGVLSLHRSHRIDSPDPRRDFEAGRPHACTLCHLDQTPQWSARAMTRLWGREFAAPRSRANGAALNVPDGLASLLGGDAVERAVYAAAMGRDGGAVPAEAKAFLRMALAITCGDGYPSVRSIARKSLLALERERSFGMSELLERFDSTRTDERRTLTASLLEQLPRGVPSGERAPAPNQELSADFHAHLEALIELLDLQSTNVISIGE